MFVWNCSNFPQGLKAQNGLRQFRLRRHSISHCTLYYNILKQGSTAYWELGHASGRQVHETSFGHAQEVGCRHATIPYSPSLWRTAALKYLIKNILKWKMRQEKTFGIQTRNITESDRDPYSEMTGNNMLQHFFFFFSIL